MISIRTWRRKLAHSDLAVTLFLPRLLWAGFAFGLALERACFPYERHWKLTIGCAQVQVEQLHRATP